MTENHPEPHHPNDPWHALTGDWDQDSYQQAMLVIEGATITIMRAAPEAAQFMIDLMNGRIKDPDGNYIEVHDIHERFLAAQTILEMAGLGLNLPELDGRDSLIKALFNK